MKVQAGAKKADKTLPKKVISIASGKGGVGKTLTTVNFAIAAQRMGLDTLIFDGDLGLANVDVVLGLQTRYSIGDVLEGIAPLKEIILTGPLGIRIIPSGSGLQRLSRLKYVERLQIIQEIENLNESFDVLIIDTGAGISDNVLHLNAIADDVLVVTTPEPHAMTDAYAFIKVMHEQYGKKDFNLLINMVRSAEEGLKVAQRIADVAKRFLNIEVRHLGSVPTDPQLQKAVLLRQAANENSTHTIAGQEWNKIARGLLQDIELNRGTERTNFWREFIQTPPSGSRDFGAIS